MKFYISSLYKTIYIAILFFYQGITYSQENITINGIVKDSLSKNPIEFANLSFANSSIGTFTDINGKFSIQIKTENEIKLIVSHISYYKQEIVISNIDIEKEITISMLPKVEQLSDVVVSATLSNKSLRYVTKSASIIPLKEIRDNFQSNMVDVLASTPGFSQIWEYHSPLLLRGMNSNRLIVMKDGNRRIGTFPGGYFGQDVNIYDTKKIEIIKGPGSVIYGGGAISGIINILSPSPFGEENLSAKFTSAYGANNNEYLEVGNFCFRQNKFGININAKYRKTDEYIYGNGETADNSHVEDKDISVNLGYRFSNKHSFKFYSSYHYGNWGKPRGFNGPTKAFTKIRNKEDGIHSTLNYTYIPNRIVKSVHFNLFYDDGSRDYYKYKYNTVTGKLSTLDLVHYKNNYGGGRLYTIISPKNNLLITAGIDGYFFNLDNPSENIDYYNNTSGRNLGYTDAGQSSLGVFINNELTVNRKLTLTLGIRYDYAKVNEGKSNNKTINRSEKRNALSGNAGLVYSINDNTHLSLNIGRAFRMPISEELFTTVISCKGTKKGNPDLTPEYSWNFDLGFRGTSCNKKLNYDLALFYNILDDFIAETADNENEDIDFTYENINAKIAGGEISASYQFEKIFSPVNNLFTGLSASYQYGIDLSKDGDNIPLFGIPPFKLLFGLKYQGVLYNSVIDCYFIKLATEFAAEQNRVAEVPEGSEGGPWGYEPSESHVTLNLSFGLNFNAIQFHPKLRFIVKNLLDTDYQPFGSYIPAMGRNIKILLSFNIF